MAKNLCVVSMVSTLLCACTHYSLRVVNMTDHDISHVRVEYGNRVGADWLDVHSGSTSSVQMLYGPLTGAARIQYPAPGSIGFGYGPQIEIIKEAPLGLLFNSATYVITTNGASVIRRHE